MRKTICVVIMISAAVSASFAFDMPELESAAASARAAAGSEELGEAGSIADMPFSGGSKKSAAAFSADALLLGGGYPLPVPSIPAAKSYAVRYSLRGVLTKDGDRTVFKTEDGRVFRLLIDGKLADEYNGKSLEILANAEDSDDLEELKLIKARETSRIPAIEAPEYKPQFKPVSMLENDGTSMTMTNVRWDYGHPSTGTFDWATAVITPGLVKNVYLVKQPFQPEWLAAHAMFVFTFEKGGLKDVNGNEAHALMLGIEAALRVGQEYSMIEGLKDKIKVMWLLASWEEYVKVAATAGNRFVSYPVLIDKVQKEALLKKSLSQAAVNRTGEFYNTVTNNCTNNLVILLNHVLPEEQRIHMWFLPPFIYNLRATVPVLLPSYLQGKGLLGPALPVIDKSNYEAPLP